MPQTYALVLVADKNYIEYTKQVFYTASRFGNWNHDMVLLAYEIENKDTFSWFIERHISIIEVNAEMLNIVNITPEKKVYFAKLLLFHPILSHYKRIVYLDIDIIVKKDINGLLKYKNFTATNDYFNSPLVFQFGKLGSPYSESKINGYFPYNFLYHTKSFNTGVMVIQSKFNSQTLFNELITLTNTYGHLSEYKDQGIINLKFIKTRKKLPYVYNDYYAAEPHWSDAHIGLSIEDSVVLHLIHPYKPWQKECHLYEEWLKNWELSKKSWQFKSEGKKPNKLSIYINDLKASKYLYQNKTLSFKKRIFWKWLWRSEFFIQKKINILYYFTKSILKRILKILNLQFTIKK